MRKRNTNYEFTAGFRFENGRDQETRVCDPGPLFQGKQERMANRDKPDKLGLKKAVRTVSERWRKENSQAEDLRSSQTVAARKPRKDSSEEESDPEVEVVIQVESGEELSEGWEECSEEPVDRSQSPGGAESEEHEGGVPFLTNRARRSPSGRLYGYDGSRIA